MIPWTERRAAGFALFVVSALIVLSPALRRTRPRDDFPISPYGMFADPKDENTRVTHAVAILAGRAERIVPPRLLATDEVLQSARTLELAARSKASASKLCDQIASRVASEPSWDGAERIEVRTVTYASLPYFDDPSAPPVKKRVHARCRVPRSETTPR